MFGENHFSKFEEFFSIGWKGFPRLKGFKVDNQANILINCDLFTSVKNDSFG